MRRRVAVLAVLAGLVPIGVWRISYREMPPDGRVVLAGDTVDLTELGYCWSRVVMRVCSDNLAMFLPLDSLYGHEIVASPGARAEIGFSRDPRRMSVHRKRFGVDERVELPIESGLRMPEVPGRYVFTVWAEWRQGDLLAAFRVVVE